MKKDHSGFATRAIHAGQEPDPLTGAVSAPIYPTSTYVQEEIGKNKGYEYARVSNPTRDRLETNLAALENGVAAKVFASGMAATISTAGRPASSIRSSPTLVLHSPTSIHPISTRLRTPSRRTPDCCSWR